MSTMFEEARRAVARLAAEVSTEPNPQEVEAVLRERGRQLAARERGVAPREILGEFVVVYRDGNLFGLPTLAVHEVRRTFVLPLPHASAFVQGLVRLQGHVHALIDLLPYFATPEAPSAPPMPSTGGDLVALVGEGHRRFGIRVDQVVGARRVYRDECGALRPPGHDFTTAVTADLVSLIDVATLSSRPELILAAH